MVYGKDSMATKTSSPKMYDVFLSFRGEDTRLNVTDHLYKALSDEAIFTFRDDKKLERGRDVAPELLKAIEDSRFAIVVFSKDYASSTWCLIELAKIVECKKKMGLIVLPVFYRLEAEDVKDQTGEFGKAFAKHYQTDSEDEIRKVNEWREALTEVASNIQAWHIKERRQTEVNEEIVKVVLKELNLIFSSTNNDLVGMASRIEKMYSLLNITKLEVVLTVGIWGMAGIGKTTIAEQVKTQISDNFNACAFIPNVREEFENNGIIYLQNLLYKYLLNHEGNIQYVEMGRNVLRNRLGSRRVLIILDDVDKLEQIEDLVGSADQQKHGWLGPGSRVIVTTKDKHLLKTYGEDNVYEVDGLSDNEALQLFSRKAFKRNHPFDDFVKLSHDFVKYANGHPLALKLLGSFLFGGDMDKWKATLKKFNELQIRYSMERNNGKATSKKNPEQKILPVLQISFDGLDDDEKEIFLDIACFFKGEEEYRVKKILKGCELHPVTGIAVLIEKSLITIMGNKLRMHDLLQQFGQYIVRREFPEEPGKHSRIWFHQDACNVLEKNTGTKAVKGIFLNLPKNKELNLSTVHVDPILQMKNIRLLKFQNVHFPKCVGYLPNELRLLEWHGYPQKSMPSSFCPNKLVELNMSSSRIERLWKETTHDLEMLISINLSHCVYLNQIPDLKRVPNLERLILEGCKQLSEVHPSIGELKHLVLLNLKGCESLKNLSQGFNLESLETLILSGCTKLTKFPEIVGNMDNLSELYLDGTAIKGLPISVKCLNGLILLNLRDCMNLLKLPDELCCLTSLKTLDISGCSHVDQLPENIGRLEQLETLDGGRTAIRKVPPSMTLMKNLKRLCFAECSGVPHTSWWSVFCCCLLPPMEEPIHFQLPNSLSGHFMSLTSLCLRKCNLSNEAIPEDISCLSSLKLLDLGENNFVSLPDSISQLFNLKHLYLDECKRLESLPKLPLGVKYVYAHGCPMLKNSNDEMTIWISDRGFTRIYYQNSGKAMDEYMFGEHAETLYSKHLEDYFSNEEMPLKFEFACTRIPEWCSQQNIGSSTRIQLPLENKGDQMWMGFAIFAEFCHEIDWKLENAYFHFETDKGDLGNEHFVMDHSWISSSDVSYAVCIYIPRAKFTEELKKASHVAATISTDKSDIKADMCGMHLLFNKDVPEFSKNLAEIITNGINFNDIKGRKEIKATKFETSGGANIQCKPHKQVKQESCNITAQSDSDTKTRRDLQWLVQTLLQRCDAHNYGFAFHFPLKAIPTWFFHHSAAPFVVCYLPMNLFDEKPWVGFCLYVLLTWPNNLDSQTPLCLDCKFQIYGDDPKSTKCTVTIKHKLVLLNTPRVYVKAMSNQCLVVSASFRTSIPEVEVEMCGIRQINEQDLGDVIQMITDITLSSGDFCYEEFGNPSGAVEFGEPEVEIPIDFDYYERESLKESLSSTERIGHFPFSSREKVGRHHFESSYQVIPESTPNDSSPVFINLQIVAENALKVNDLMKWQKRIEESLKNLAGFDVVIALILEGHVISVLKPFNPLSNYNLCFPRKEILDWFEGYQVCQRNMKIKLPPNVNVDKSWRGLAVCAYFSIHEHPTAVLDHKSLELPFGLRCHLNTEEYSFHPPIYVANKVKFTWLYMGGFIWLTYIPSYVFAGHLNEQSYLDIYIFSECPGMVVRNLSARFLYQQDVEELAQSIAKCTTSFFDNLDPIHQIMAHQHCECFFHFYPDCSLHYLAEIATYCGFENENPSLAAKTESIYPRKSGLDFDGGMIYDSCFRPTEILDWFGQHNSGSSVTVQLPSNVHSDGNWLGLALCAYFSGLQHQEILHNLTCQLKSEKVGLESWHEYQITNEELKKLNSGEFIWVSYIPCLWFSDQLNRCSLIEASFESDRQGLSVYKCGLRLLYQHDEEEFKQTINYCMVSFSDSISESDSFTQEASTRKTGRTMKQAEAEDKGKQIQQ